MAFNDDHPQGQATTVWIEVIGNPVYHVSVTNSTPLAPYRSWATAARTIQEAITASVPGALILVTNGVYDSVSIPPPPDSDSDFR